MDYAACALDDSAAYQVLAARDARFDGRLFVGVTSTGIYCRPICRVRTPSARNCRYFETPAQAEAAAFRPCMKCRPEIAPGANLPWTVMDASRTLARQAGDALDAQAASGEPPNLVQLADRLGISDRHLRRIFQAEHGVTPLQYLQTRRLLLAKQLLTDTRLPVAQVALASGFASLRRFNAAFVQSYRMSPSRLRHDTDDAAFDTGAALTVKLAYRAPYDIAALLRFFAQRAIPGVEAVEGLRVRRSLRAGTVAPAAGWIEAEFASAAPVVQVRYAPELASASGRVVAAVRRWLDLDAMPQTIDAALTDLPGAPGMSPSVASIASGAASRSSQRRAAPTMRPLAAARDGAKRKRTCAACGENVASIQPGAAASVPARTVRRMPASTTLSMPGIARCSMKRSSAGTSYGAR